MPRFFTSPVLSDVKPENVLLGESASGVHVKLCDFATAKDVRDVVGHRSSTFVGSAEYVSPELLGFDSANGRYTCFESDIWAAGCIMYFMLSGLPPFRAESDHATFRKVETVRISRHINQILDSGFQNLKVG